MYCSALLQNTKRVIINNFYVLSERKVLCLICQFLFLRTPLLFNFSGSKGRVFKRIIVGGKAERSWSCRGDKSVRKLFEVLLQESQNCEDSTARTCNWSDFGAENLLLSLLIQQITFISHGCRTKTLLEEAWAKIELLLQLTSSQRRLIAWNENINSQLKSSCDHICCIGEAEYRTCNSLLQRWDSCRRVGEGHEFTLKRWNACITMLMLWQQNSDGVRGLEQTSNSMTNLNDDTLIRKNNVRVLLLHVMLLIRLDSNDGCSGFFVFRPQDYFICQLRSSKYLRFMN